MIKSKVKTVLRLFNEKRVTTVAGAWVYYFLTSVIPLAFLVITAFGVFGVNVSKEIVSRLPEEFRLAGETIASTAENASKGVTALFVLTIIFSCTTLLNQMSKDGDFIYGLKSQIKRGVMRRIWALVALAALFAVFLSAAVLFAFGNMIFAQAKRISVYRLLFTVLAFALVILFGYLIIMLLNRFISPVRLKFKQVSIGSLISVSVIVLGTIIFTLYLRFFANYNAFYGSLAAIIVFLLWTYISMLGLVVGVIINERIYSLDKQKSVETVSHYHAANSKQLKKA